MNNRILKITPTRVSRIVAAIMATAMWCFPAAAATGDDAGEGEVLRPVNSSFMLDAGSAHVADTYLSPLKYTGWNASFTYERLQAMKFNPSGWRQQLQIGVEVNGTQNPAGNAEMYYANLSASWGMLHLWRLPHGFSVAAGGSAGADLGGLYNSRNGNNPATAKADITLNATGYATWSTRLWRLPVMFRWQTTLPLTGAFFSPEYDELYYEIYLGNRHGLAHWAWPGNLFRWDNLVTADLDFATTRLRVGFRSRILSSEVNHITTRIFSYSFVIGVTGDWFSVSPRKGMPDMKNIEWDY